MKWQQQNIWEAMRGTRVKASYILGGWLGSAAIISGPRHLRRTRTRDAGWDMAVNKWGFHSNRLSLAVARLCPHILKSGRLIERLAMWSDLCTCLLFAARALLLHHPGQLKMQEVAFCNRCTASKYQSDSYFSRDHGFHSFLSSNCHILINYLVFVFCHSVRCHLKERFRKLWIFAIW